MLKKIITAAVTLFAAMNCCLTAFAATYVEGVLEYTTDNGSVTITGYSGSEETVIVPAMIAGEPVAVIESGAFPDSCGVRTVYLPDTIVYTAEDSFGGNINVVYSGDSTEPADSDEDENSGGSESGDDLDLAPASTTAPSTEPAQTTSAATTLSSVNTTSPAEVTSAEVTTTAEQVIRTTVSEPTAEPESGGKAAVIAIAAVLAAAIAGGVVPLKKKTQRK